MFSPYSSQKGQGPKDGVERVLRQHTGGRCELGGRHGSDADCPYASFIMRIEGIALLTCASRTQVRHWAQEGRTGIPRLYA